jgi:hypothetical protein
MDSPPPNEADRTTALTQLAMFQTCLLPTTVRRIAAWKQLSRACLSDLLDDVRQELAVDCLEHAPQIVGLAVRDRHQRWMRIAERWIYHQRIAYRWQRTRLGHDDALVPPPSLLPLPTPPRFESLQNGRLNRAATATRAGRKLRELTAELEGFAWQLGHDDDHHGFWCRRAAEALTGVAADLLRARGGLHLIAAWPEPDVDRRLQRVRQVAQHFVLLPTTRTVRSLLRPWLRRPRLDTTAPRRLLAAARALRPDHAAVWLWTFEAELDAGQLPAAGTALRQARACVGCPPLAQLLARARLLEARGRLAAAARLLQRGRRRRPRDAALAGVVQTLLGDQTPAAGAGDRQPRP